MKVGLCNRTAEGWLNEFRSACEALHYDHKTIAIGEDDWMSQLEGVDVFVWRLIMSDVSCMAEARTKIPLIEEMGIACFPSARMLWLYDDKIRETFFFRLHQIPVPRTWVFFDGNSARAFAATATYPLVAKSHCGASSSGVVIIRTRPEAEAFLDRMFQEASLWEKVVEHFYYSPRLKKGDLLSSLRGRYRKAWPKYAYFQEFIHTEEDWRITTLGADLVSVFVRRNRPDDFRASGSGLWKRVSADELPVEACDLALDISHKHGFTSMTYDFMRHTSGWVIGEISYAFLLNAVYTETLFRKDGARYVHVEPIPIGVMHLQAVAASQAIRD